MKKYLLAVLPALLFATTVSAAGAFTAQVSRGMQSPEVQKVQQFLSERGYLQGPYGGYYGAVTAAAVLKFQKAAGVNPPNANRVGPMTLAALNREGGGGAGTPTASSKSIPVVMTLSAVSVTTDSAVVRASFTPTETANAVRPVFLYGQTLAYGKTVQSISSSSGASARLAGLSCGTLYHYKVSASNSAGTSNGADMTFTTASCR